MAKASGQTSTKEAVFEGIRQDLAGIKYKMLNELFLQAVNNEGFVDRSSTNFKTLEQSFLNADPQSKKNDQNSVTSVLATEQGALGKLDKLNLKESDPQLHQVMEAEIRSVRTALTKQFSSDEGVKELLIDFLKQKSMEQMPFQVIMTKKEGMYDVGDPRPMANNEVKVLTNKLMPHIDFKDINVNTLVKSGRIIDQGIAPIIQEEIIKYFGKPLSKDSPLFVLDETKLTDARMREFGEKVSKSVAIYSKHPSLSDKIFKQCEEKGISFSRDEKNKIMGKLGQYLTSLGSEHLSKYENAIAAKVSDKLIANRSLLSRITGDNSISVTKLEKIGAETLREEMPASLGSSTKKFNEERKRTALTDKDFSAKLAEFSKNHANGEDLSKKSDAELVKIRAANPKAFDAVVFPSKPQAQQNTSEMRDSTKPELNKIEAKRAVKRPLPLTNIPPLNPSKEVTTSSIKNNSQGTKVTAQNTSLSKTKSTELLTESPKFTQAKDQIKKGMPNRSLPTIPQSGADIKLPPLPKSSKGNQQGGEKGGR